MGHSGSPLAILCAVLLLTPAWSVAQVGAGRVTGLVRDERGQPIKGVTVTAENEAYSPRSFTVATDAKGRFSVLGLRRATYKFTVLAEGYEPMTFSLPVQMLGPNPPLDLKLARKLEPGPPPLLANVDAGKLQRELDEAAVHVAAGRTDAAIAAYRRILQGTPSLTSLNLQLGYLHEVKGDRTAAIAAYEAALNGDPASATARDALARLKR